MGYVGEVSSRYRVVRIDRKERAGSPRSPGECQTRVCQNSRSRLDGVLESEEGYRSKAVESRSKFGLVDLVALAEIDLRKNISERARERKARTNDLVVDSLRGGRVNLSGRDRRSALRECGSEELLVVLRSTDDHLKGDGDGSSGFSPTAATSRSDSSM